jgi:hypothetical protein
MVNPLERSFTMSKKNTITGPYVKELQSRARKPAHRNGNTPAPFAPMPEDLENQVLSPDPLERLRQLDQQEADRIERTEG